MNMGETIKEHRLRLGLTQEALGKKVGVNRAAVQKWECGSVKNIKRTTIKTLAEIFQISPSELLGLSDELYNDKSQKLVVMPTAHLSDDEKKVLDLYKKLDIEDKAEIRGEMKHMLKAPKYGMVIPVAARGGGVSQVRLSPEEAAEARRVIAENYPELLEDD